jgi:hypothetical protein
MNEFVRDAVFMGLADFRYGSWTAINASINCDAFKRWKEAA